MIFGDRVRQAREFRGLTQTQLAKRLRINQSAIAQIETGRTQPSHEVIQGIVLQTAFPLNFFRQPPTTEFPLGTLLFRSRALTMRQRREAHQYGQRVFELLEAMERHFTPIPVSIPAVNEDPATAARLARSAIGLAPDSPVGNLARSVEKAGVLVLALPTNLEKRDAFCAWAGRDALRPVIVLCGYPSGDRLRFSLAHELGHLVLHRSFRSDMPELEDEANSFAGEFLLPESAMRRELLPPITLTTLARLKSRWKVSIQALAHRAYELEIISPRQYKYLRQQVNQQGWLRKEPIEIPIEKPRALSQMAETLYGKPLDYRKVANAACLPIGLTRDILMAHAGIGNEERRNTTAGNEMRVLDFKKAR
jgi:Zn-dependent peptidase ImmA (M78 family)/transcriptional regulator with XRE-family HTH domain